MGGREGRRGILGGDCNLIVPRERVVHFSTGKSDSHGAALPRTIRQMFNFTLQSVLS